MSEGIELPPLDKESELLVMENGYFTYSSVRSFREAAEKRIAELERHNEALTGEKFSERNHAALKSRIAELESQLNQEQAAHQNNIDNYHLQVTELESQQAADREDMRVTNRALDLCIAEFWHYDVGRDGAKKRLLEEAKRGGNPSPACKSHDQSNPAAAEGGR